MSTDYKIICFTCKEQGPVFASGSIAYGYKVWLSNDDLLDWLGHRESVGRHEHHDLRIISPNADAVEEMAASKK